MKHMGPMILDAEEHMRLLATSGLRWAVLRAPIMSVENSREAILAPEPGPVDGVLSYDHVAALLITEIFAENWLNAAPFAVAY
ncbi:MAG: hypothetical protein JWR80_5303 [Bradyrhizobium sp.]|nr:hypothetical protein [Bradyrhizobium sp.]